MRGRPCVRVVSESGRRGPGQRPPAVARLPSRVPRQCRARSPWRSADRRYHPRPSLPSLACSGGRETLCLRLMEDSQPLFLPELLRKLTARDVMTAKPLTVTLETKLSKVMEFVDERHIQHFPVVEDERLGMLSEHDLHDAMPSVLTVDDPKARRNYLKVTRVAQVLPKDPRTVSPGRAARRGHPDDAGLPHRRDRGDGGCTTRRDPHLWGSHHAPRAHTPIVRGLEARGLRPKVAPGDGAPGVVASQPVSARRRFNSVSGHQPQQTTY